MTTEDPQKQLEKFQKAFDALMKKFPKISVYGDRNGDPIAMIFDGVRSKSIKLSK
jgi:hypothetical protein